MSTLTTLQWRTSPLAGAFHAARVVLEAKPQVEPALADALAVPAQRLREALHEENVPAPRFWEHVVAMATECSGSQELATVVLTKTVGQAEAGLRAHRFAHALHDLQVAYFRLPGVKEAPLRDLEALKIRWNGCGQGLLTRIAERTEPGVLVENATVIGVYPAQGGGGSAYLPYNRVCIEVLPAGTEEALPEVVRLGWLISTLNLDVPCYADGIRRGRLTTVATLAMLPVALSAAADLRMLPGDAPTLGTALEQWLGPPRREEWTEALGQWWQTYQTMRPSWANALKALDLLLEQAGKT
jgi:hypothetical protein